MITIVHMRLLVCIAIGMLSTSSLRGQQYSSAALSAHLAKDAHAVVRKASMRLDVRDEQKASLQVMFAVSILDVEGRDRGTITIPYDRFRSIDRLDGRIFNAEGILIKKLGKDDFSDHSAISNYSLYEDSRFQYAELYHDQFPYTVEFSYDLSMNGYIGWPAWFAQDTEDPVEHTSFEIEAPTTSEVRYWCNRDSIRPTITTGKTNTTYSWKATNLAKIPKDAFRENREDVTIVVRTAPSTFSIDGKRGSMATWKDFGAWYYSLGIGRDRLPDKARQDVLALVGQGQSTLEKTRKIYNYLQEKTRYVSVQLGIGGWQPFDASYVYQRGYGDCKALSNYMVALLREVQVPAYQVLIRNGESRNRMITEFSSNQFNHVIVCVPNEKDSIWLECTSQSIPFGHIGRNNEERNALLISSEGGIVVRTPTSTSRQNAQERTATVQLSSSGAATVSATTIRSGNQQDYVRSALEHATAAERERWILKDAQQPSATLLDYTVQGLESQDRTVTLSTRMALPRLATPSGNRLMFRPNLMEQRTAVPTEDPSRLYPVYISYRYYDADSISFAIPNGFTVEALPKPKAVDASFGAFSSRTLAVGDSLLVFTRTLDVRESVIPAKSYGEYQKFFAEVVRADRDQVVLVRKRP